MSSGFPGQVTDLDVRELPLRTVHRSYIGHATGTPDPRHVISSVGHSPSYPGFSGAARVCPQGRSKRALAAPEVPG